MELPGTCSRVGTAAAALSGTAASSSAGTRYDGVFVGPPRFSGALFPRTATEYAEIFGGFVSSCTIPFLDLPAAGGLNAFDAPVSPRFEYQEIFRDCKGVDFALTYEELLLELSSWDSPSGSSASKKSELSHQAMEGLKQNLECPGIDHSQHAQNGEVFSRKNNLSTDLNEFDVLINERSLGSSEKENLKGMRTRNDQAHEAFNIFPDSGFSLDKDHVIYSPEATSQCSRIEDMHQETTIMNPSSSGASVKSHSRSSRFNTVSIEEIFASDATYVTISGINLRTQPVQVPPPSRPPPKVLGNRGHPRMMIHASSKSDGVEKTLNMMKFDHSDYLVDDDLKCHVVRDKSNDVFAYHNVDVETSPSAAMEVAIVQAQDKLKSAKELMERRRVNVPRCKNLNEYELKDIKEKREDQVVEESSEKAERELCEILMMNGPNLKETSHSDKYRTDEVRKRENGGLTCSHPAYLFEGRRAEWKTDELFHELTKNNFQYKPVTRDFQDECIPKKFSNSNKANRVENVCLSNDKNRVFFSIPIVEREIVKGNVWKAHTHEDNRDIVKYVDDNDDDDGNSLRDEKEVPEAHSSETVEMQSSVEEPIIKGLEVDMLDSCEKVDCCKVNDERTTIFYVDDKEIDNGHKVTEAVDISKTLYKSYDKGYDSKSRQVSQRLYFNETEETISRSYMEFGTKADHMPTVSEELVVTVGKECTIGVAENKSSILEKVKEIRSVNEESEHVCLENELKIAEQIALEAKLNVNECGDGDVAKVMKITPTVNDMKGKEELDIEVVKRDYRQYLNEDKAVDNWVELLQNEVQSKTRITFEEEFKKKLKIEEGNEHGNKRLAYVSVLMDLKANDDVKNLKTFIQRPCEDLEVVFKVSDSESSNAFSERIKEEKVTERKLEEEKEREREREKDRRFEACERSLVESRGRAERFVMERVKAETRQQSLAEAQEKLDKVSSGAREHISQFNISKDRRKNGDGVEVVRISDRGDFSTNLGLISSVMGFSSSSQKQPEPLKHVFSAKSEEAGGESPLRCKARLERYQRTVERAAKALAEMRKRDIFAQREQTERDRLAESLDSEIKRWSNGKERNLRALLSTLQYILGPDSGWKPIPLTEVITAAAMKKAYRKATLCVHPDKLQQKGASVQHKYICEKVFDLLREAWNSFNSEDR